MTAEGNGRLRSEGIEPVRRGDHAELAETIGRFIEDSEHRALAGERARQYARAHGAQEMVRATLEVYESVSLSKRRNR
jgi:glycosyltransferase involved in cell wall biosynthesis